MIQYNKFPFTELQGKLPCLKKPSRNSSHKSNSSNPKLPFKFNNTECCIIFKSLSGSSTVSKMTRIYTGRSGVQILAGAIELSIVQNIQTSSSTHPASNSMKSRAFSLTVKWPVQTSLNTHICVEPSLQISGAIPPLNLSPSMAHIGTSSFYPNHLPHYISLYRSHPFWSYKGTFLYITFRLHSHYMTHLFNLH